MNAMEENKTGREVGKADLAGGLGLFLKSAGVPREQWGSQRQSLKVVSRGRMRATL